MNQEKAKSRFRGGSRRAGRLATIGLALSISPAWGQSIDTDADSILRTMTDQLKDAEAFAVEYDADHELVDLKGQKLQYSASGAMTASRGSGFLMTRKGPYADMEISFDGKVISLYGKGLNVYAQIDSPGPTIDEAVQELRMSTGLDVAGADLLSADPYAALTEGVVQGSLVGTAVVGGVECDHLAFRNDAVDWQIWISKGEQKLPMKYVITTKWVTAAPQYSLRLSNWTIGDVDTKLFSFTPPADAKRLEEINADAIGELVPESGQ